MSIDSILNAAGIPETGRAGSPTPASMRMLAFALIEQGGNHDGHAIAVRELYAAGQQAVDDALAELAAGGQIPAVAGNAKRR